MCLEKQIALKDGVNVPTGTLANVLLRLKEHQAAEQLRELIEALHASDDSFVFLSEETRNFLRPCNFIANASEVGPVELVRYTREILLASTEMEDGKVSLKNPVSKDSEHYKDVQTLLTC